MAERRRPVSALPQNRIGGSRLSGCFVLVCTRQPRSSRCLTPTRSGSSSPSMVRTNPGFAVVSPDGGSGFVPVCRTSWMIAGSAGIACGRRPPTMLAISAASRPRRPAFWHLESSSQAVLVAIAMDHGPTTSALAREGTVAERVPGRSGPQRAALGQTSSPAIHEVHWCLTPGAVPLVPKRGALIDMPVEEQADQDDDGDHHDCGGNGGSTPDLHRAQGTPVGRISTTEAAPRPHSCGPRTGSRRPTRECRSDTATSRASWVATGGDQHA